jgi:hypothetical protein
MMRIYIVKTNGEPVRYVRASSQSAAIKAVVNERYSAVVATTEDIVSAAKAGALDVLDATAADPRDVANPETGADSLAAVRHNSRMPVDA